jgi:hypothetical protein
MLLIGFCKCIRQAFLYDYNLDLWYLSDRFRTAINVFGDSIGCAIVQHLSRKELAALDNKEIIIDKNLSNTVLPLVASDAEHGTPSNHVLTTIYDNPTFTNNINEDK